MMKRKVNHKHWHGVMLLILLPTLICLQNSIVQAQAAARAYSAGQIFVEEVTPDSLGIVDADVGPLTIPLIYSTKDAQTGAYPTKFIGYQVMVSNVAMQITFVHAAPTPEDIASGDLEYTKGKLRLGIYIPAGIPLSGNVELGQVGARVEVKKDNAQGIGQVIATGQTSMLSTSPQLFVLIGNRNGGSAICMNEVTAVSSLIQIEEDPPLWDDNYFDVTTPNPYSDSQDTRVILFGTGFRNADNTDLTNDIAGVKNVAEAYKCKVQFTAVGFPQRVRDIPPENIEYIGPVKDGMPGMDEIIIRLPQWLEGSKGGGEHRTVDIWLIEAKTNRDTNIPLEKSVRVKIPVR